MGGDDLVADLSRLDAEIKRFQMLVSMEETRLQRLGRKYEHVKTLCCLRRTGKVKEIIVEATEECLKDTT